MTAWIVIVTLIITTIVVFAQNPELDQEWEAFKKQFNKNYPPEEDARRRLIWEETVQHIKNHNEKGDSTFFLGINQFADMNSHEIPTGYGFISHTDVKEQPPPTASHGPAPK